jgi:hypothetical protein
MDPTMILSFAKKAVGDKAWTVELVLRVGAELAEFVNKFPNLSGKDKCQLVCQTILKMLDDVEKVERERSVESTEREKTIALLGECRAAVNTVLPVSLELMVMASRGKFVLKKIQEACVWLPSLSWPSLSWFDPCGSVIQETNKVVDLVVKQAESHLEEMRGLVAKAEALVASAEAKAEDLNRIQNQLKDIQSEKDAIAIDREKNTKRAKELSIMANELKVESQALANKDAIIKRRENSLRDAQAKI